MYIYILAFFLQTSPFPVVAFYATYESKDRCIYNAEVMKEKLPEEKQGDVVCLQFVRQSAVKDI
jgi:hypothetical protein